MNAIKPKPPKFVYVTTGNNPDRIKCINWTDSSDRKWLTNHMHWAVMNDHSIFISANRSDII